MLLELRVKDFGIIEDINWNLSEGLNVITGETGAGKSLVIDAVEALLSGKIEEDNIRYGSDGTFIEGLFALPDKDSFDNLKTLLEENGLSSDDGMLVISCELKKQGRSVMRINRRAVPRSLLSQVGAYLIDIHGQSDHLSLLNTEYHIDFLDSYAHTLDLRQNFATFFSELSQVESELQSLAKTDKDTSAQEEFLRFQVEEIKNAKLVDGEDAELEQELKIISASEQLKASSFEVYGMLDGDDSSSSSIPALEALNRAVNIIGRLAELDPSLKPELALLEGVIPDVEEAARSIRNYSENMEFDVGRLAEIEDRLELIRNLKRKYGQSIPEILSFLEGIESKLGRFSNSAERIEELKKQSAALRQELGELGFKLSKERMQAAKKLIEQVNSELAGLKMEQVRFDVSITQKKSLNGIPSPDGENYEFTRRGVDFIEFMAATNPGEPFKPLAKIASTGEISRFMLALKGAFSKTDNIPILVFDEIDIGVGGRCGEVIGEKLWSLAQGRQVLCITHLPQIAVFADAQHAIRKNTDGSRASTTLESLKGEALVRELTMMLVGSQYSEASVKSVKELMQKAEDWKKKWTGKA